MTNFSILFVFDACTLEIFLSKSIMDVVSKDRLDREKHIKSKLVNIRKVIKNKFAKARKNRLNRERDLEKKYKPITSAIKNLATSGKLLDKSSKGKDSDSSSSSDDSSDDESMDFEQSTNAVDTNVLDNVKISGPSSVASKKIIKNTCRELVRYDPYSKKNKVPSKNSRDAVEIVSLLKDVKKRGRDGVENATGAQESSVNFDIPSTSGTAPKQDAKNKDKNVDETITLLSDVSDRSVDNDDGEITDDEDADVEMLVTLKRANDGVILEERARIIVDKNNDIIGVYSPNGKAVKLAKTQFEVVQKYVRDARQAKKAEDRRALLKDRERARIHNIRAGAKDKEIDATAKKLAQPVEISSDDEDESDDNSDIVPFTNPSMKRKQSEIDTSGKFVRTFQTPVKQKQLALHKVGTKSFSAFQPPRRKKVGNTPLTTSKVAQPGYNYPYLTGEQLVHRLANPPEPDPKPNMKKVAKEAKSKQKKKGGNIETEFIPYMENVAYEFYDDPNELCERLKLLIASRVAGNTNHAQEINSLVAELRESGYIA